MTVVYPPTDETSYNRQGKISHLITIIINACGSLNNCEKGFLNDMLNNLNRVEGLEPSTALTEPQARKLRHIIYKKYNDYSHAVPSLPEGVDIKWEVRRLLKSSNKDFIEKAKERVEKYYDQSKYVGMDGDNFIFIIRHYSHRYDLMWEHDERTDRVQKISIEPNGKETVIDTILHDSWTDHSDTWSYKDTRTDKRPYTLEDFESAFQNAK